MAQKLVSRLSRLGLGGRRAPVWLASQGVCQRRPRGRRNLSQTPALYDAANIPGAKQQASQLPIWEPGSAVYGDTLGQNCRQVTDSSVNFLLDFVDTVTVKEVKEGVFTVADYGANDGYTSMGLMTAIIGHMRKKHGEKLPIQVIYEDQEQFDYNSLFNRLCDGTGFSSKFSNVYPLATNTNFYQQCLPEGTCDVIYSSLATSWLNDFDMTFKAGTFVGSPHVTNEELDRFRAKAAKDWTTFLTLRAKELKPGGLLMLLNLTSIDDFFTPDGAKGDIFSLKEEKGDNEESAIRRQRMSSFDIFMDIETIWTHMRDEGTVTQEEHERAMLNGTPRTRQEETGPFLDATSQVHRAGLSLISHDQVFHNSVFKATWQEKLEKEGVDDREMFAEYVSQAYRLVLQTSYECALSPSRSAEDKAAILDQLFQRYQTLLASKDPATYRCDYIISRLIARKL